MSKELLPSITVHTEQITKYIDENKLSMSVIDCTSLNTVVAELNVLGSVYKSELELVIMSTGVGIWDWQVQIGETIFNERWANIIGYTLEELSPVSIQTWRDYAHPEDLLQSEELLKAVWRGETEYYTFESRMRHKNGDWVWVLDTGQVVEWQETGVAKRMIGTHVDITAMKQQQSELIKAKQAAEVSVVEIAKINSDLRSEIVQRKKMQEQLHHIAMHDALTDLPNRKLVQNQAESFISLSKRMHKKLVIAFIDLDGFKQINDTYGHDEGDTVLIKTGKLLNKATRESDFVGRIGGDEFMCLFPNISNIDEVEMIVKRIYEQTKKPIIPAVNYHLKLSIGIAIYPTDADNYPELMKLADQAMYIAKNSAEISYKFHQGKDCSPTKL
jgi:diguanylate cyclase (GGDEF)-like protein/PAS domain S-box-containing protein